MAGGPIAMGTGFGPTAAGIGIRMNHSDGPVSIMADGFTKRIVGVGYPVTNGRLHGFPGEPGPSTVAGRRYHQRQDLVQEPELVAGAITPTV